jgi:hypothetical protein
VLLALTKVAAALAVVRVGGLWPWPRRAPTEPQPTPEPDNGPHRAIPSRLDPPQLDRLLAPRLAGTPTDGSAAPAGPAPSRAVWVDRGDEVVVHLDSVVTRIADGILLVSIDLESAETGRAPLVVALGLGVRDDPAGLVCTTDELPRGNAALAARWGEAVQAAVWSGLLTLVRDHANERDGAPQGMAIDGGALHLREGEPMTLGSKR